MSMVWDAPLVAALGRELETRLRGVRLRAHRFDGETKSLLLFFRELTLHWHLHPSQGWLQLEDPREPPPSAQPLAARVEAVVVPPDERILFLELKRLRGKVRRLSLVVELLTNQWNALLTEGSERWMRRVLWSRPRSERPLITGHAYRPPPPSERIGIDRPLSQEEWAQLIRGLAPEAVRDTLLRRVAYTSPLNVHWLADPARGHDRWLRLRSATGETPCVFETTGGWQPYIFCFKEVRCIEMPSILEALQAVAHWAEGTGSGRRVPALTGPPGEADRRPLPRPPGSASGSLLPDPEGDGSLRARADVTLAHALERRRRRLKALQRQWDRAGDPNLVRRKADLLLSRLSRIPKGVREVQLQGFEGEEVTLRLDPAMTPQENAAALYREAARMERARDRLPDLIQRAQEDVDTLEALQEDLRTGSAAPDEVLRRLGSGQGASSPADRRLPSDAKEPRLPYRRFRSSGGLEIRVGRGAADNHALTFRHSDPEDIWLHARAASGAHVVLRWKGRGSPPASDLREAATLAAVFSRARTSAVVPVDWTRRKHVRKPRGAPEGTVVLSEARTLFVEPDEELPDRLAWRP